ncbi:protein-tyrosine phosphatase-like protein [Mycena pura]|uniref:protein-tyrosine-phosphatase n=1 Tax=Mycena pura TaxID=153505 RepID=A0AAD6VSK4_9AGAR|nr:protein-tyrosine phosphatase-like protein [Mycena pura]
MVCDFSPSVDEVFNSQIYLGNLSAAQSHATRERFGISHILSVCPDYPSTGAKHLVVPVKDSEYDDLLIHLPHACSFIQDALDHGGRVLIHCVLGISRSTTVLMKSQLLTPSAAIGFIKQHRSGVQPNYGFLKQLDVFLECGYAPSATHPAYISWKRKRKQDVTNFLNYLIDTTVIIPDVLFLSSEFPSEPDKAELTLYEFNITHFLSLGPVEVTTVPVIHHRIDIPADAPDELLFALPDACTFIRDALANGGKVLVHSLLETRACTVVAAHLMTERNISSVAATKIIQDALPLFHPTRNFTRALSLFHESNFKPAIGRGRPAISAHDTVVRAALGMSESDIDLRASNDTLAAIQQKTLSLLRLYDM